MMSEYYYSGRRRGGGGGTVRVSVSVFGMMRHAVTVFVVLYITASVFIGNKLP